MDHLESAPEAGFAYSALRSAMETWTDARFNDAVRALVGSRVVWIGYVEEVTESSSGEFEVLIDMDPPSDSLSVGDVRFKVPREIALSLWRDQEVTFTGLLESVRNVLGTCQITLEPAKMV
jgi:hypothetical protein